MNPAQKNISGIILAGGQGQRLGGVDKGLVSLCGKPLIAHVAERLSPQVGNLIISANRNLDDYSAFGCTVVEDLHGPYLGPLAGIAAALATVNSELALVVPCDTPFLPHDLCQRLHDALQQNRTDVAIAHDGQRLQPMCTLLRRELLDSLNGELAAGHLKVQRWMMEQRHCVVEFSDQTSCFINVNTGDDLIKAAAIIAGSP